MLTSNKKTQKQYTSLKILYNLTVTVVLMASECMYNLMEIFQNNICNQIFECAFI